MAKAKPSASQKMRRQTPKKMSVKKAPGVRSVSAQVTERELRELKKALKTVAAFGAGALAGPVIRRQITRKAADKARK